MMHLFVVFGGMAVLMAILFAIFWMIIALYESPSTPVRFIAFAILICMGSIFFVGVGLFVDLVYYARIS